ncbi:MAG: glycosyltransferase [Oscillospiraceae bacterium]|nr:glycosyltransferase [Oscillospiraceae bacterium]MBQ9938913.1 glycosyltransferase [Oscillospiraceae bacterium]
MKGKTDICIMTSVHPRDDARIYRRQAVTLARSSSVLLLAPDKAEGRDARGVLHKRVAVPKGRAARIGMGWLPCLVAALKSRAPVCIFHDPELLPAGLLLKLWGRRVVMDLHEQLHLQIMTKPWIAEGIKPAVSRAAKGAVRLAAKVFDLVLTATPAINRDIGGGGLVVRNFPVAEEYAGLPTGAGRDTCYIGTVSVKRGSAVMAEAARLAGVTLHIAGEVEDGASKEIIAKGRREGRIKYYGRLRSKELLQLKKRCSSGLCLLSSAGGYPLSLPIKLFEYLAMGLEPVATDIPYWRQLTQNCSEVHFVKEGDAAAAAEQIKGCIGIKEERRRELLKKFCWEGEGRRLTEAIKRL